MPAFFTDTSLNMTVFSLASLSRVRPGYLCQHHFTDMHHYWVVRVVQRGLHSAYPRVKYQAAKLLFLLVYGRPEFAFAMLRTPTLMTALLTLEADLPIQQPREDHMVLNIAAAIHFLEIPSPREVPSRLTQLLASLLDHDDFYVRQAAAKTFACLAPTRFLAELVNHLTPTPSCPHSATSTPLPPDPAYALGTQFAIACIERELYGSADDGGQRDPGELVTLIMGPLCWPEDMIVTELHQIYTSLYQVCAPLVTLYADTPCEQALCCFLRQLRTVVLHYQHQLIPSEPGDDLQCTMALLHEEELRRARHGKF
ncbi:hypothetical protein ACN4EK_13145 [Pantanalinema rosaneae CENA516]|uniref:hypothetical protein n=1 Tax=Pantanalinema rosaneae TaxID=1620701 RepID=UPI003D6EFD5D